MAERKPFLLRLDPAIYAAMQHWADDELRSLNAQIEYVLRRALREAGRIKPAASVTPVAGSAEGKQAADDTT